MIPREMPTLEAAINKESYEWLLDNAEGYATAVDHEVAAGATPDQVYRFVVSRTGRIEIALRCKQAAAHLKNVS